MAPSWPANKFSVIRSSYEQYSVIAKEHMNFLVHLSELFCLVLWIRSTTKTQDLFWKQWVNTLLNIHWKLCSTSSLKWGSFFVTLLVRLYQNLNCALLYFYFYMRSKFLDAKTIYVCKIGKENQKHSREILHYIEEYCSV